MKYQPSSGSKVGSSSSSKAVLNTKNIAKGDLVGPPPLTLQEKVNKAIEGGDSEEHALFKLKDNLSKLDKSNIWSQYQTFLKHNKEEKDKYEHMSNLDKGNAQTLWFIKKSSPKFFGFKMELSATDKVTWKDEWCSHKDVGEVWL